MERDRFFSAAEAVDYGLSTAWSRSASCRADGGLRREWAERARPQLARSRHDAEVRAIGPVEAGRSDRKAMAPTISGSQKRITR